jgi:glycosyltransferase involved in cell wall biosynthesis
MKICHLTSVHPRNDTRIFIKECRSLARAGHEVSLVVADGLGNAVRDNVNIVDVGRARGRWTRMTRVAPAVGAAGLALNADAYHLHDPELLPVGLWLKWRGKRVVFDAHEDVPRQLLDKPYLNRRLARPMAAVYERFENFACSRLDAIVAATPTIRDRFAPLHNRCIDVNNFPSLEEFPSGARVGPNAGAVAYVGAISQTRGIREIVAAMGLTKAACTLELAGRFAPPGLKDEMASRPQWRHVRFHGQIDRDEVRNLLQRCFAGLVTLHPTASYLDSLPVKMFEYMGAGLPVIASDFPLWRDIVQRHGCGVCVDPRDPAAIAAAIDNLAARPAEAARMGANGRLAIETVYNWAPELDKLLRLYDQLNPSAS